MATYASAQKNRSSCLGHHKMNYYFVTWLIFVSTLFFSTTSPVCAQINTDHVTLMGRNALSMDDYVTAIHYFNQVIEVKPHLYAPYYYRAYAKFSLEDYVGAEADCSRALHLNPYMGEIHQLRGLCRIHNENFEGAIEDYTYSLKEEPDDQGAIYNRALCRLELKDYVTADKDLDLLLSKWKNFQRAYLIKAQICMEQKDTLGSIMWVDSLLQINPRNEQAWSFKGRYALSKERFEEADSCLTKAIHLNPSNYEHYVVRAQARHGLNHFEKAMKDYDHTIDLVPQHFIAHYNRGLLRALVGDKNRAIEDFDFILKVEPDNTLAIYNRALLKEETGDYKGAIADYSQLIAAYPNFTYGYMARANCRRKVGDTSGAVKDESVVARAQLDLKYKPHQRKPIKKVRQRSEHSLDQYQQLVEEQPDTTRRYVNELMGKVQNRKVEQIPLPAFTFAFRLPSSSSQLQPAAFLPEVDHINHMQLLPVPFTFEASTENLRSVEEMESGLSTLLHHKEPTAELHFLLSIVHTALYNYEAALEEIGFAMNMDSTSYLYPIQCATIHAAMHQSIPHQQESGKKGTTGLHQSADVVNNHLKMALTYINKALELSPKNAYLLYNRGCLYMTLQQPNAALADFNQAITIDSHLSEGRYNRAILYLRSGDVEAAIPDLSRAGQDGLYKAYNLLKQAVQMKAEKKREKEKNDHWNQEE